MLMSRYFCGTNIGRINEKSDSDIYLPWGTGKVTPPERTTSAAVMRKLKQASRLDERGKSHSDIKISVALAPRGYQTTQN